MNDSKTYSKYSQIIMRAELSSQRQVRRTSNNYGNSWTNLDDSEEKRLKRSQFAFGALYPYTFDGISYIATHHKELIKDKDDYYYMLELPFNDFCHYCLLEWHEASYAYLRNELLKRDETQTKDEHEFLKYIPFAKGDYVSLAPIRIGFHYKLLAEMLDTERKKLVNLGILAKNMKAAKTIILYVLKPLLMPILSKNSLGGFFSVPSALQAKIDYAIQADKQQIFSKIKPLFARKYYMLLNSHDGSKDTNYMLIKALDLWEHVSPSEIIVNRGYTYLRDEREARRKLEDANKFFAFMETQGLMKGAKAFPSINDENNNSCPSGVYYHQDTKTYQIYFKRNTRRF